MNEQKTAQNESDGFCIMVDGTGTIGLPTVRCLKKFQSHFGLREVICRKYSLNEEHLGMLWRLHLDGIKLAVEKSKYEKFAALLKEAPDVFCPEYTYEEALEKVVMVIDCTKDGEGLKNKEKVYSKYPHLVAMGQGSETHFGFPYAYGHNDDVLDTYTGRYVWIMSCNVHAILAVLHTLTHGYQEIENIVSIRFHLERRGADVVNKKTIVTPEVGVSTHPYFGTHQAEDAMELLKTLGIQTLDMHAVADKDPQPFMHKTEARIILKKPIDKRELIRLFQENIFTGITYHRDIGGIYVEGDDWGLKGRINLQCVLVVPSVEQPRPYELVFTFVTPQDGNPIFSSCAALGRYLQPERWRDIMRDHFHPYLRRFQIV